MPDPRSVDLPGLLRAVCAARSDVLDARHAKTTHGSSRTATEQRLLLEALERYAAALSSRGSPMPYRDAGRDGDVPRDVRLAAPAVTGPADPRAIALGDYLRERAAAFSLSADVMGSQSTASAGMALLDAAHVADSMTADDPRLRVLSEAGLFESMPEGRARFVETDAIRAAIQRPLVDDPQRGTEIVALLVSTARGRQ